MPTLRRVGDTAAVGSRQRLLLLDSELESGWQVTWVPTTSKPCVRNWNWPGWTTRQSFPLPERVGPSYTQLINVGWQLGPMYRPAEAIPVEVPEIPDSKIIVAFGIPDFDPLLEGWLSAVNRQATVIWDRQGWLSRARDAGGILRLDALTRIYLANEYEAIDDAQASSIEEAMTVQPVRDFDVAVVKRGKAGVVVIEERHGEVRFTSIPAFPVNTRSTVGSGDVFAGVFAARLALGSSVVKAAKWGCAAAAVSLQAGQNLLTAEAYEQANALMSD